MAILPRACVAVLALLLASPAPAAAPDPDEARIDAALDLFRQRKPEDGRAALERVAAEVKGRLAKADMDAAAAARCHFLLARATFHLRQDDAAVTAIDQAVKLAPAEAKYHNERGEILAQVNKPSASIEAHAKAVELEPRNADYWIALGYRYSDLSAHDEAIRTFEKAIAANPAEPRLLGALAGLYANTGKLDSALPLLEKAIKLDPKYVNAWRNLGQIHQSSGRHAESNAAYGELLKVAPDDAAAWSKLVQNHTALNQPKERDAARAKLYELHKAGKAPQPFFCREQFKAHLLPVMVFEYYELAGARALRYSFRVLDESGRNTQRTISLGSYEMTTQIARESGRIGKDQRMFHLDLYEEGGHSTFGMYDKEPTYEAVRATVVGILDGKVQPLSSTKMGMKEKEE